MPRHVPDTCLWAVLLHTAPTLQLRHSQSNEVSNREHSRFPSVHMWNAPLHLEKFRILRIKDHLAFQNIIFAICQCYPSHAHAQCNMRSHEQRSHCCLIGLAGPLLTFAGAYHVMVWCTCVRHSAPAVLAQICEPANR